MTAFGSSASCAMISDISIWSRGLCKPSTTVRHKVVTHVLGTFCYLCLRYGQADFLNDAADSDTRQISRRCSPRRRPVVSASHRQVVSERSDSMAILFKTTISENSAFEMIERSLSGAYQYDGYLNVVSDVGETALSWGPAMHAEEFKAEVSQILRQTWDAARFWVIYERREDRKDPEGTDIRNAAFRLTRGYSGVIVVTLSLLGKLDSANDLELVFVCFEQDFHRRNFRVRYEGKPLPNQD